MARRKKKKYKFNSLEYLILIEDMDGEVGYTLHKHLICQMGRSNSKRWFSKCLKKKMNAGTELHKWHPINTSINVH